MSLTDHLIFSNRYDMLEFNWLVRILSVHLHIVDVNETRPVNNLLIYID